MRHGISRSPQQLSQIQHICRRAGAQSGGTERGHRFDRYRSFGRAQDRTWPARTGGIGEYKLAAAISKRCLRWSTENDRLSSSSC
jgi:hypothetical protein